MPAVQDTQRVGSVDVIRRIIGRITYKPGWHLDVKMDGDRPYLQVRYDGTGASEYGEVAWTARKWPLSLHMVETEIVSTAFKAVVAAEDHETREIFRYEGVEVFGPHWSVRQIVNLVKGEQLPVEVRPDAMQGATE